MSDVDPVGPHEQQRDDDADDRLGGVGGGTGVGDPAQADVVAEEVGGVITPGGRQGEDGVAQGPGDDDDVVGHDDEADDDVPPAQPLEPPGYAPEDGRRGSPITGFEFLLQVRIHGYYYSLSRQSNPTNSTT